MITVLSPPLVGAGLCRNIGRRGIRIRSVGGVASIRDIRAATGVGLTAGATSLVTGDVPA